MPLFLPFTPRAEETEQTAIMVKRKLGLGAYDRVDPFAVLRSVPARLIDPMSLPNEVREVLFDTGKDEWSAVGFGCSPYDGCELVLLNPSHHERRRKATLMEEVVHIVLGHPKVSLRFDGVRWRRPYDAGVEDEAFNVGAACIIPYKPLFNAVRNDRATAGELADFYGVSSDYVEYRIKRAGLYRIYRKNSKS